jgi:cysteine desulfurase
MNKTLIYLDYNATAPVWPEVRQAVLAGLAHGGNPSSVHKSGREARAVLEKAREYVASTLSARAQDVVFTSGGTEANAQALRMAGELPVLVSAIEHDSVLAQAPGSDIVPVTPEGVIDLVALEHMIACRAVFLSLMAINNESGIVQPVREAARLVHLHGGRVHCDASQVLGKMPFRLGDVDADFFTLSAHKIGGPQGVGALVVSCGYAPNPIFRGGGQELGYRAGTENVAGIAGFAAALEAITTKPWRESTAFLRDKIEAALPQESRVIPGDIKRAPNTALLRMPGVSAATQVMMFDLEGFAVSAGSACSSGKVKPSHVLLAMGKSAAVAAETIRVSLGWDNTEEEVDAFIAAWHKLRARTSAQMVAA